MSIEEIMLEQFNERDIASGKVYKCMNLLCDAENALTKTFTEEQQELYRKFTERHDKLTAEELNEAVIYGFRFAVSIINELKQIK